MSDVIDIESYKANKQLERDMDSSAQEGFDIFRVLRDVQRDYRDKNGLPIIGETDG